MLPMQSVLRSFRILEAVAEHQPVGVGELSRLLELPKSTVQRSLMTLDQAGWLRQTDSRWEVTSRPLVVGLHATEGSLRNVAIGPMQWLRNSTNETVHLAVPDGRSLILIERLDSTHPVRTFLPLGATTPLQATSTGRSILANLPLSEVEDILTSGLIAYSAETLVDVDEFRSELIRIRKQGYSVNLRQYRPGVAAVGAAVLDTRGRPVAGICISMPDSRFRRHKVPQWGELVSKAAAEIGSQMLPHW